VTTTTTDLQGWLTARRAAVDAALARLLPAAPDCPAVLVEATTYSVMAGGKRLRPMLALAAAEAVADRTATGQNDAHDLALPAACALEMIHTYSLIHDDLPAMDDDDLRRGRPTNHVVFGEALAILAGDALLTLAFEVLARETRPAHVAAACCVDLAQAAGAVGMVAGQAADLAAETSGVATLAELEGIHRRKTGRLLCSALTLGARIAQADESMLTRLREYGLRLGLAFQIVDDLLDVRGDVEKVGKGVGKDAAHNKLTYPALLGEQASSQRAEELIGEARALLAPLGGKGASLDALARFVLERDH
jgi:geranylgeranyl diphosphate synthase type II